MESRKITATIFDVELKGVMEIEGDEMRIKFESGESQHRYETEFDRAMLKNALANDLKFEQNEQGRVLSIEIDLTTLRYKFLVSDGSMGWSPTLRQGAVGAFVFHEPDIKWLEEHL